MLDVIGGPVMLNSRALPFSRAVVCNGFAYVSGQLALADDGVIVGETIAEQTEAVIANLARVLEAAGSSLDQIVKTTCWLTNRSDFDGFNTVYARHFMHTTPARSTVCSDLLVPGALVEIDAIAYRPESV